MNCFARHLRKKSVAVSLSLTVPFLFQTLLIVTSRIADYRSPAFDNGATCVSVTLGVMFLGMALGWRALLVAIIYVPAMCFVLFYYSFLVVGAAFGDFL